MLGSSDRIRVTVLLVSLHVILLASLLPVAAGDATPTPAAPLVLSTRVTGAAITEDFADFVGKYGQASEVIAVAGQNLSALISVQCGETHELYTRAVYRANDWPVDAKTPKADLIFNKETLVFLPPCIPVPLYRVETVTLGKGDSIQDFFRRDNAGFKILRSDRESKPASTWLNGQRFSQTDIKRNELGPLVAWRQDEWPRTWGMSGYSTPMSTDSPPSYKVDLWRDDPLAYSNALQMLNPNKKNLFAGEPSSNLLTLNEPKEINVPRSEKRWISVPLKDGAAKQFGGSHKTASAMAATFHDQVAVEYDTEGYVHFSEVDSSGCSAKNALNDPDQSVRNAELMLRILLINKRLSSVSSPAVARLNSEIVLPDAGVFSTDNSPFRMPAKIVPLYGWPAPDPLRQYSSPHPDQKTKREHGTKTGFVAIGGPILYSAATDAGFDITLRSVNIYNESYRYAYKADGSIIRDASGVALKTPFYFIDTARFRDSYELSPDHIVNFSLGHSKPFEGFARHLGEASPILFVAAAGNGNPLGSDLDQVSIYPARHGGVAASGAYNLITVAGVDGPAKLAPFSNYSSRYVDIGAQGCRVPTVTFDVSTGKYSTIEESGTSLAAPQVAFVASILKATIPTLRPAVIKSHILASSDLGMLKDKIADGRTLNAAKAFASVYHDTLTYTEEFAPQPQRMVVGRLIAPTARELCMVHDLAEDYTIVKVAPSFVSELKPAPGLAYVVRRSVSEPLQRRACQPFQGNISFIEMGTGRRVTIDSGRVIDLVPALVPHWTLEKDFFLGAKDDL